MWYGSEIAMDQMIDASVQEYLLLQWIWTTASWDSIMWNDMTTEHLIAWYNYFKLNPYRREFCKQYIKLRWCKCDCWTILKISSNNNLYCPNCIKNK